MKLTKLTFEGKAVTLSDSGTTLLVRCGSLHKSVDSVEVHRMSEGRTRELIGELEGVIPLSIGKNDTEAVRVPGTIGICNAKSGRLMAYMVNDEGKLCNVSTHNTREEANYRVYLMALMYSVWGEHIFMQLYNKSVDI